MRAKITENEKKVYEHIKRSLQEGYAPTVREICAGCGFKSTSTAHRAIKSLKEKGYLEKQDNLNRAIKLAGQRVVKLPLITAAEELEAAAIDQADTFIDYNPRREHKGKLFAVTVQEDIPSECVKAGDVIVAELCDEPLVSGLAVMSDGENQPLKVGIAGTADTVIGKVAAVIRYI